MTTPSTMLATAAQYVAAGLSVIPIDPNPTKRPAFQMLPVVGEWPDGRPRRSWSPFKGRRPNESELATWFDSWGCACGIAIVCGEISGRVEAIDIDSYDHAEPWLSLVREEVPEILDRLVLVQTPRPGLHIYYRCPFIGGNEKLAQTIYVDEASMETGTKTVIETRGEGGYALIPPTPTHCHPTGRTYEYRTSRTLVDVETISVEERNILFQISKSFDTVPVRQPAARRITRTMPRVNQGLPGDDFNARVDWSDLLERHGWTFSHIDCEGKEHWMRPGKSDGTSATVNFADNDLLHVFTSNASPLEQDKSVSKFQFLTVMEYDGDFQAAAQALQRRGYGHRPLSSGRRRHHRQRTEGSSRRNTRRRLRG